MFLESEAFPVKFGISGLNIVDFIVADVTQNSRLSFEMITCVLFIEFLQIPRGCRLPIRDTWLLFLLSSSFWFCVYHLLCESCVKRSLRYFSRSIAHLLKCWHYIPVFRLRNRGYYIFVTSFSFLLSFRFIDLKLFSITLSSEHKHERAEPIGARSVLFL